MTDIPSALEVVTKALTKANLEHLEPKEEPMRQEEEKSDILTVVSNLTEEIETIPAKPVEIKKYRTKADLIESILKLTDKHSKRSLHRRKKMELEELLGTVFNEKVHEAVSVAESVESDKSEEQHIPGMNNGQVSELLYRLVLGCCQGVENLSFAYRGWLGGFHLSEYAINIDRNPALSSLLKESLFEVFTEHAEIIAPYLTSSGKIYCVLIITMVQSVRKTPY